MACQDSGYEFIISQTRRAIIFWATNSNSRDSGVSLKFGQHAAEILSKYIAFYCAGGCDGDVFSQEFLLAATPVTQMVSIFSEH